MELFSRIYDCTTCGNKMDRDLNAAINILRAGTAQLNAIGGVSSENEQIHLLTILANISEDRSQVL